MSPQDVSPKVKALAYIICEMEYGNPDGFEPIYEDTPTSSRRVHPRWYHCRTTAEAALKFCAEWEASQ